MSTRDGELYFAPGVLWSDVQLKNDGKFRQQLMQRFEGFYFKPARALLNQSAPDDFAAGLLILCAFDAIARLWTGKPGEVAARFKETFEKFAPEALQVILDPRWSVAVYDSYRNGLVHELRIKKNALFDVKARDCISGDDSAWTVNPRGLLCIAEVALKSLVSVDNVKNFDSNAMPRLREDFGADE
jgi:hypothetical protein